MNWKESLEPYLYKHRIGGSGSTNDLLDAIETEIIEKLIADIPNTTYEHILEGNQFIGGKSFANLYPLKQELRNKWL